MTIHMLSFRPDFSRLTRLAARERLLPPGNDLGYALHAVLAASFGELAPKPFALLAPCTRAGGPAGRLLAYSPCPLDALIAHARDFADPAFSATLGLDAADAKAMPETLAPGVRLGFRVRIRPVVRTGKPLETAGAEAGAGRRARERDAFLAAVERAGEGPAPMRGDVYVRWLAERLAVGGGELKRGSLESLTFTRLLARNRAAGAVRPAAPSGPDATVHGELVVTDPDAFIGLLARGVGRHRAFGFGMILLTPGR